MTDEHKISILMLDDEKFLLNIYKMTFEKRGFEVRAFFDADEALAALRAGYNPEVILFDLTMPDGRSGYEFLEIVHREKLAKQSLKIALTNQGKYGEMERLDQLSADAHLLKAKYIPSEISATVKELLKKKRG